MVLTKYREGMLTGSVRQYVIDKVKKPLEKAITALVKRYPEPTRENCLHPNTHRLFDIMDKFFSYENNPGKTALFEAAFKILIAEYEHDPYYRWRFDWMLEEIWKSGWEPRPMRPMSHWKEPGMAGISKVTPMTPAAWAEIVKTKEPYRSALIQDLILDKGMRKSA